MKTLYTLFCLLSCFYCNSQNIKFNYCTQNNSVRLYDSLYADAYQHNFIAYSKNLLTSQKRAKISQNTFVDYYAPYVDKSLPIFGKEAEYSTTSVAYGLTLAATMFLYNEIFIKKKKE
jgi:hypothetical protein